MRIEAGGTQAAYTKAVQSSRVFTAGVQGSSVLARRDTISLNGRRERQNSLLDSLMKQRASVQQHQEELISATKEKGGSVDSIKPQLDSYQKMLDALDEQIAEAMARQATRQLVQTHGSQNSSKPQTREEAENRRLASLTSMAVGLEQAKAVSGVRTRLEGEARVLEAQSKMDGMRGAGAEAVAVKEAAAAGMTAAADSLNTMIAEILADAKDHAAEEDETTAEKEQAQQ